ncbi:MAG: hypothetical protein RLZZ129_364, partial [Verrucomicrobiota bacterium]
EAAAAKHLAATTEALTKLPEALARARTEAEQALMQAQAAALRALEAKLAAPLRVETPPPAPTASAEPAPSPSPAVSIPPVAEPLPEPTPEPAAPAPEAASPVAEAETSVMPPPADEPKPKKPRAPRKPKVDELNLPMPGDPPADEPVAAQPAPDDFTQVSPEENTPATSVSTDGATRLLVTAYIGIGNRLFVRGTGPGLSPEKGVPLQFVSIGKWRWESTEATGPLSVSLYKNDETPCAALGEITLEPGRQTEVTATF